MPKQFSSIPLALKLAVAGLLSTALGAHARDVGPASADVATTSGTSATQTQAGASAVDPLSEADRKIVREIAEANLAEIATSELALDRSKDPQIKQYAERMIEDHKRIQERIVDLARVHEMKLPDQAGPEQQRIAERLSQLEGEAFDDAYRRQMGEQAHRRTHEILTGAVPRAENEHVAALIAEALPLIEQHLASAEHLGDQTSASGGSTSQDAAQSGAGDSGAAAPELTDPAESGASAPAGASGASMASGSDGGASGGAEQSVERGAESVSGTQGSNNMRGPGPSGQ